MSPQTTVDFGRLGGISVLDLNGLWTRYKDPEPILEEISHPSEEESIVRLRQIHSEPIQPRLITERLVQICDAGVVVIDKLSPQLTQKYWRYVVGAGIDLFVIRGSIVSMEHMSNRHEPLSLKRFIYEPDIPAIVEGACADTMALHLIRTGVTGILVGFGGGAVHSIRQSLGAHAPMATMIADVAAARHDYADESDGRYVHVIVNDGIGRSGDFACTVTCGADIVMLDAALTRAREAPRQGWHWGLEVTHPDMSRGQRAHVDTSGTLEQVLHGPLTRTGGSFSLVSALKRTMASTGYAEVKGLQRVEAVASPCWPSEAR